MIEAAGFVDFIQHDFKDPANLYYEGLKGGGFGVEMWKPCCPRRIVCFATESVPAFLNASLNPPRRACLPQSAPRSSMHP